MNFVLTCLLAFCFVAVDDHCGNFPARQFDESQSTKWKNRYTNLAYGYSVRIPKGRTGYSDLPPSPQHGFGLVLSWEPRAYLYVDGSYNSLEVKNAKELEQLHLKWLAESAQVIGIEKHNVRLGSLPARRYVARYTCKKLRGTFIEDETILLHQGIVYMVGLLTTQERYGRDKVALEQMLRSWRLAPRE